MEATPPAPLRVLLIDDDPIVLEVMAMLLAAQGTEVEHALGGRRGLSRLEQAAALPDIVLVDHQMPEVSGTDIGRYVRSLPTPRPRVLAMSASPLPEAEHAHFDGFLPKPVDQGALQRAIEGLENSASPMPETPEASADVLDRATVQKLRAIMEPEALRDFYRVYIADTRQRIAELERYAASGDEEALRRCAHSLKGAAAMAGVPAIAAIAAGFEAGYLPQRTHERVFQQLRGACDDVEHTMITSESSGETR